MGRILAIDYGMKRCGIAVTDPMQIIASSLTTVLTPELLPFLKKYIAKEPVDSFVIGMPKNLDNSPSSIAPAVKSFIDVLNKNFPDIPVHEMDERFTSKIAEQTIRHVVVSKKERRDKTLIDRVSATIILQSYLGH